MNNSYETKNWLLKELAELGREIVELTQIKCEPAAVKSTLSNLQNRVDSIKNIAERRFGAESLKTSEELYKAVFESANDAIFLMQADKFIDCNAKATDMFGYTKDQIVGHTGRTISRINFSEVFRYRSTRLKYRMVSNN